jgi:hypothetical protein
VKSIKRIGQCRGVGSAVLLAASLGLAPGCGGVPVEEALGSAEPAVETEAMGSVTQALNETRYDHRVAAAVSVVSFDVEELWVFACDSTNRLMRRVKWNHRLQPANPWSPWQKVSNRSCASTPTVGKIAGTTPNEVVYLFWRDSSDQLQMIRFREDGSAYHSNLSSALQFGAIASTPIVAHTKGFGDVEVSVVVKQAATNELWSVDLFDDEWHLQPVLSGGLPASSFTSTMDTFYLGNTLGSWPSNVLTVQENLGAHFIYTRQSNHTNFNLHAFTASAPANGPVGLLTIGGEPLSVGNPCESSGCVLYRSPIDNQLVYASLANSGNVTSLFKSFYDPPAPPHFGSGVKTLGGSVYACPEMPLITTQLLRSFGRGSDGHLLGFGSALGGFSSDLGGTSLSSAPSVAIDARFPQVFYARGASNTLYHYDNQTGGHTSLGLSMLAP